MAPWGTTRNCQGNSCPHHGNNGTGEETIILYKMSTLSEAFKPLKPIAKVCKKILNEKTDEFLMAKSTGGREPWRSLYKTKKVIQKNEAK